MAYADHAASSALAFERLVAEARRSAADGGGRFLSRAVLDGCRRDASEGMVREMGDADLIACLAARHDLLDHDERQQQAGNGLRGAIRAVVALRMSGDLEAAAEAHLVDGQDAGTLPDAFEAAMSVLEAGTVGRYPLMDAAREMLGTGTWDGRAKALAVHVAGYLQDHGVVDVGGDLMAAVDAREAVAESAPTPGV